MTTMLNFQKLIMEYGDIREYSYFQETLKYLEVKEIGHLSSNASEKRIIPSYIHSDREKGRVWT